MERNSCVLAERCGYFSRVFDGICVYPVPGTCLFVVHDRPALMTVQLPNVDPESGVKDEAVPYKVLMKFRTGIAPSQRLKPCIGCNGAPSGSGVIKVGDLVNVVSSVVVNTS